MTWSGQHWGMCVCLISHLSCILKRWLGPLRRAHDVLRTGHVYKILLSLTRPAHGHGLNSTPGSGVSSSGNFKVCVTRASNAHIMARARRDDVACLSNLDPHSRWPA